MIITRLGGGMGNQMFQYALGRALSLKHNVPLGLDLTFLLERVPRPTWKKFVFRNYDLDHFNISARIVSRKEIPLIYRSYFSGRLMLYFDSFLRKTLKFTGVEKAFNFNEKVLSLDANAYITGYWQSPKYFSSIEDVIRKDFTLNKPLSEKAQKLKDEIMSHNAVCVNVRRTDFVANPFHGTFEGEYYDKGVAYVAQRIAISKIYVFSDDMEWCEQNLRFDFPTMFVGHEFRGEKFEEYLMLMAACKHFVIPNSTFAWWGAWLSPSSEKIVVCPKQWFPDSSKDTSDLIPEGWIRI